MNSCKTLALLLMIIFTSCEKDDICSEATQTTPRIVIDFYDAINPQETKAVEGLAVYAIKNSELFLIEYLNGITTESIAIPLRNDLSESNFLFIKDYSFENDIILGDSNYIYIEYNITDVFVSRACGFIANYYINTLTLAQNPPNIGWITGYEIAYPTITNENQAHVKILH